MIILGVDPGTVAMGYGVIRGGDDEAAFVDCGVLNCNRRSPIGERLAFLYRELTGIISRHHPRVVAVEQPFVAKNVQSALAIGKAQAVAMLAAANHELPCYEYTPAQVKQRVADYGASSKEQVREMVRLQLGMDTAPSSTDASDALAVALCHWCQEHLEHILSQGDKA